MSDHSNSSADENEEDLNIGEQMDPPLHLDPAGDTGDLRERDVIAAFEFLSSSGSNTVFILLITKKGIRTAPMSDLNQRLLAPLGLGLARFELGKTKREIAALASSFELSEDGQIQEEDEKRLRGDRFEFASFQAKDIQGNDCIVIQWREELWAFEFSTSTVEKFRAWGVHIEELNDKKLTLRGNVT